MINRNLTNFTTPSDTTAYNISMKSSSGAGDLNWSFLAIRKSADIEPLVHIGNENIVNYMSVFNNTNVTLFVWNATNAVIYQETKSLTGNSSNNTLFQATGLTVGELKYNVLGCSQNQSASSRCSFASSNLTFTYGYTNETQSYNNNTFIGIEEDYLLNLSLAPGVSASANLIYNGTSYSASSSQSGGTFTFERSLIAPSVVTATNFTFFWQVTLNQGPTTYIFNSTQSQQQVFSINIDNCTSFNNRILNFTVRDEETQALISNPEVDIAVNIFDSSRETNVLNYSANFTTVNPVQVCLSQSIFNNTQYSLDTIVKYSKTDTYATEYYNIVDLTLNGTTPLQNINLYDLNINDSTDFKLIFTGSDFLPEPDALVYVEREYIADNNFKTVELPITDSNGETIVHLVRNDVRYNFRFVKNGVPIANFEKVVAFCQDVVIGDCQLSLASSNVDIADFSYTGLLDGLFFSSAPTFDQNTSTINFDYLISNGESKLVSINITRNDVFGNRSICSNSLDSSSGTLSCSVNPNLDTVFITKIYVDGINVITTTINNDPIDVGSIGYIAWFLLTLIMIFIFGDTKNGVMLSMIISYVGAVLLGFNKSSIVGLGSAGIWILIITLAGIYQLNKRRPQ